MLSEKLLRVEDQLERDEKHERCWTRCGQLVLGTLLSWMR